MNIYSLIQDFGWCDIILARLNEKARLQVIGNTDFRRIELQKGTDIPWRMTVELATNMGILPKEGRILVYEGPIGLVNPDPGITLQLQESVFEDIISLGLLEFNVLSFSIGNYLGFFIANHCNVQRFVSVFPGSQLGAGIFDSIATIEVKNRAIGLGIKESEMYDLVLAGTNPIENLVNLPKNLEIHIAGNDYFIPTRHAEELIIEIQKNGLFPKIIRYKNKGHVISHLQFGQEKTW